MKEDTTNMLVVWVYLALIIYAILTLIFSDNTTPTYLKTEPEPQTYEELQEFYQRTTRQYENEAVDNYNLRQPDRTPGK